MSAFYDNLASTASRLISKYGQTLYIVKTGDSIDPVTGVTTSAARANIKVNGILQNYPDNLIDGTRIKSSDRMVIIGGTVKPLNDDRIRIENQDWSIESIKTSNPAGTALVHFIQARR